jgi:hypothetical protein
MRGFDAFAGVIKSGGKTRRAAKMVILNVDHPDIVDFIECKAKEEAKAFTLIKAGYDGSGPDSEAFSSIFFQNANNSVRVSDEFMRAYEADGDFTTYTVKGHEPVKTYKAREIMHKIAESTWLCGDPGMQFDDTINKWHTSKNTARINASNPCSEYMFLDNSACNLASFNLMKFVTPAGRSTSRRTGTRFRCDHGDGDPGGQLGLSDRGHLAELARLPAAGAGLRQPGRAADVVWAAVRLRSGTRPGGEHDGDHVRAGVSAVGDHCGAVPADGFGHAADRERGAPGRSMPRLLCEPRAVPRRDPHASRRGEQHRQVAQPASRSWCRSLTR